MRRCPCCDDLATVDSDENLWFCACLGCGLRTGYWHDRASAELAWNRRRWRPKHACPKDKIVLVLWPNGKMSVAMFPKNYDMKGVDMVAWQSIDAYEEDT